MPKNGKICGGKRAHSHLYLYGGGLVFCLPFCLFARQKQHILAILKQKRERGRNKKDDQTWSCFFWPKSALFPQFQAKLCLKGRQKTRPWPSISMSIYIYICCIYAVELYIHISLSCVISINCLVFRYLAQQCLHSERRVYNSWQTTFLWMLRSHITCTCRVHHPIFLQQTV